MKGSFTRIVEVTLVLNEKEALWLKRLMEDPTVGKNAEMRQRLWDALPSIEALKGGDDT